MHFSYLEKFNLWPRVQSIIETFEEQRKGRVIHPRNEVIVGSEGVETARHFFWGLLDEGEQLNLKMVEDRQTANRDGGLALLTDLQYADTSKVAATALAVEAFGGEDLQSALNIKAYKVDPVLLEKQGKEIGIYFGTFAGRVLVGGLDRKKHLLGFGLFKPK